MTLTIQDLGSLGELIAAIATVITLAYLAVQIRQSAKATRQSAFHSALESGLMLRLELIREPEVAAMYLRGLADHESLSREGLLRFNMLMQSMFENLREIYEQHRRGDGDEATWQSQGPLFGWLLAQPGGEWAWRRYAEAYAEFAKAAEALRERCAPAAVYGGGSVEPSSGDAGGDWPPSIRLPRGGGVLGAGKQTPHVCPHRGPVILHGATLRFSGGAPARPVQRPGRRTGPGSTKCHA